MKTKTKGRIKRNRLRFLSILMALVMMIINSEQLVVNAIDELSTDQVELANDYIEVHIKEGNGRFAIGTKEGAYYDGDENKDLLFENEFPDTSFTSFKINGETYIFGNDYGFLGGNTNFKLIEGTSLLLQTCEWIIDGVKITQEISLKEKESLEGCVNIAYKVVNESGASVSIGSRILLDTKLGDNDGAPILYPGNTKFIHTETELVGSEIPAYWKAYDQTFAPKTISYGLLDGWRSEDVLNQDPNYNTKPDKMVIGHWDGLSSTKWDYTINPNLDFTKTANQYGSRDSAVALYWSEKNLSAGETRVFETYYGLDEYATVENSVPVKVYTDAIDKLHVNSEYTDYIEDKVTVTGQIDNINSYAKDLTNAKLTFETETLAMSTNGTPKEEKVIGTVAKNDVVGFEFVLNTTPSDKWVNFRYKVTLTADNLDKPVTQSGNIIMPSIKGTPPEMLFTGLTRSHFYNEDETKRMTINGELLSMIAIEDDYKIIMSEVGGTRSYEIPKENIDLRDDQIECNIQFSSPDVTNGSITEQQYDLRVEYTYRKEANSYTLEGAVTFSNDKKYMLREYAALMVKRSKVDDEWVYNFIEAKTENDILSLDDDKDIILVIRGDKIELDGNGVYTVRGETTTLNSMVNITYNLPLLQDEMTIKQEYDEDDEINVITITGFAFMTIPLFPLGLSAYEIIIKDGEYYTIDDYNITNPADGVAKDDCNYVTVTKPSFYKGIPVVESVLYTSIFPIGLHDVMLFRKGVSVGGYIDFYKIISGGNTLIEKATKKKDSKDEKKKDKDKETDKDKEKKKIEEAKKKEEKKDDDDEEEGGIENAFKIDVKQCRINIDQNGNISFGGVEAEGSIGLSEKLCKSVLQLDDFACEGDVYLNTLGSFELALNGNFNIKVVEVAGGLRFLVFEDFGIPVFIMDKVEFKMGFEPGIPLVPPTIVGYITGGEGGMYNMLDTYLWARKTIVEGKFIGLPPAEMRIGGSIDISKVLKADSARVIIGGQRFGLECDNLKVGPLSIFESLYWHYDFSLDPEALAAEFSLGGELNIKDIIKGSAEFAMGVEDGITGPFAPAYINGSAEAGLYVPKFLWFKNIHLGSVHGSFSEKSVAFSTKFGFRNVGVTYYWGGGVTVGANGEPMSIDGVYTESCFDAEGNQIGQVVVGENITVLKDTKLEYALASTDDALLAELLMRDKTEYTITSNDYDNIAFSVESNDRFAECVIRDPNGNVLEFEGVESIIKNGVSVFVDDAGDEQQDAGDATLIKQQQDSKFVQSFFISNPLDGVYTIKSDIDMEVMISKADDLPELTSASSELTGNTLKVDWDGLMLTDQLIDINIVNVETNKVVAFASDIAADSSSDTKGEVSRELVETLDSGDYRVELLLKDPDDKALGVEVIEETFVYSNPNEPTMISELDLEIVGDGMANVAWNEIAQADGYEVIVYTLDANNEVEAGKTYDLKVEDGSETIIDGKQGTTNYVEIRSYNDVGDKRYYSKVKDNSIFIPVPVIPTVSYNVTAPKGSVLHRAQELDEEIDSFSTKEGVVHVNLGADQICEFDLYVDDEFVYSGDGSEPAKLYLEEGIHSISIDATTPNKDVGSAGFRLEVDQTKPNLLMDSPETGASVEGDILVKGSVDPGTSVYVNGVEVPINEKGIFETFETFGNYYTKDIVVKVYDENLNETVYESKVVNGNIGDIKGITIVPETDYIMLDDSVDYNVFLQDDLGGSYIVDDQLVEWDFLEQNGNLMVNEEGLVTGITEGEDTLIASFKVSDDYSFEDGLHIYTGTNPNQIDRIEFGESVHNLKKGDTVKPAVYQYMANGKSEPVQMDYNNMKVLIGDDVIEVKDNGEIVALKDGSAYISYTMFDNGYQWTCYVLINVGEEGSNNGRIDKIDIDIINIIDELSIPEAGFEYVIKPGEYTVVDGIYTASFDKDALVIILDQVPMLQGDVKELVLYATPIDGVTEYRLRLDELIRLYGYTFNIKFKTDKGYMRIQGKDIEKLIQGATDKSDGYLTLIIKPELMDKSLVGLLGSTYDSAISLAESNYVRLGDYKLNFNLLEGETALVPAELGVTLEFGLYVNENENADSRRFAALKDIGTNSYSSVVNTRFNTHTVKFYSKDLKAYSPGYYTGIFKDIGGHGWADEAIVSLASVGIIKGVGSDYFAPGENITRGQYITLLMRTLDLYKAFDTNFADVAEGMYYYEAIGVAKELGIVKGTGNDLFKPNGVISRQDMMTMTARALAICEQCEFIDGSQVLKTYEDNEQVADYAKASIETLIDEGLIKGYDNKIQPLKNASRAEVAVFMHRVFEMLDYINIEVE